MSGHDGMVFEEVSYREPQRVRRPDHDRRFATTAYEIPGHDEMPIFVDYRVADAIERHALSDTSVELGGILLGRECVDDQTGLPFVWISQSVEAKHYENTQASFTYTHDSWEEITRERDQRFPDLDIVGWYHTHPDFGIFLSGHDQFIHNHFFSQPLQVAYVVDPIRQTRGFFVWRDGKLPKLGGFYLVADRDHRGALAQCADQLEGLETASEAGSLGMLSPRLEAELMSMLRRPPAVHQPVADRGQTAAVFTLVGTVLGALGLALAFWVGSLSSQLRDQSQAIAGLKAGLANTEKLNQIEQREAVVAAKESALDALLRQVRVDGSPEKFLDLYARTAADRDAALVRAEVADQVGRDLIEKNRTIERLQASLRSQQDSVAVARERLKELEQLREALVDAKGNAIEVDDLKSRLAELEDSETGHLTRRYEIAWYTAVGGWIAAVLLGLGLIAVTARSGARAEGTSVALAPAPSVRLSKDEPMRFEES